VLGEQGAVDDDDRENAGTDSLRVSGRRATAGPMMRDRGVHDDVPQPAVMTRPVADPRPATDAFVECRARIRDALGRLGAVGSTQLIQASAPHELAQACGFTRAMLSAVRGSRWVPLRLYTRDDLDAEASAFRAYVEGDTEIPLANMLAETEMVRRRTGVLVDESLIGSRAFKPIIEVARSPGYVAAPILIGGRTVGFMHADRVGQERLVDHDDRRYIQAFAGELAVLYQRVGWSERLAEQGKRASGELERAVEALTLLGSATVGLPITSERPGLARADAAAGIRVDAFLSVREREILGHVADGATNRVIAQRLSLSEDTVKTHMRSVLRKLRVTTRGAAVARYLESGKGVR
jgi:DNA-binding CsgD family transcriptional regulator